MVALLAISFWPAVRADVPTGGEEDPFQVDAVWKGKLTQRGMNPNWGEIPANLNAELRITQRQGDVFEADLRETTESLDITFLCVGKIQSLPGGTYMLTFETVEIKAVQPGTVGLTGVHYTAKVVGTSFKGDWKYPENNKGITLEGNFELTQE
jgi:hypothetical protein